MIESGPLKSAHTMDNSTLMLAFKIPKIEKPARDKAYMRWVKQWPCIVCKTRWNIEPSHTGPHGISTKASDYSCIALCHKHHQELHQIGPVRFQAGHFLDFSEIRAMYRAIWDERQTRKAA